MGPKTRIEPGRAHQDRRWLWFAVFIGPLTWAVDFALSYGLTPRACAAQSSVFLLVFSALAFSATTAGLLVALRANHELPWSSAHGGGTRSDPSRFLAVAGIAASGGFLLAIVAAAIPRLMVNPCS